MSKIKGQNFRLLQAGSAIPEATNCSISVTGNTEDTSTKDTEGSYSKETVVSTSWTASVDSYRAEVSQVKEIATTFNAAAAVGVGWDQTTGATGTQNRTAANASFKRTGNALLNDVTMNFNDRETVQVTVQFQGTGALS